MVQEPREAPSSENANITAQSTTPQRKRYMWWMLLAIYSVSALCSQSVAILLGRLYYNKGGKSKWMATLVQPAGFVILLPFLCILPPKSSTTNRNQANRTSVLTLASVYVPLGLLIAAICLLYSIGLLYLPVSTYSLISASQLAFNAFFSFFLNSKRLTPLIVNSLVLLTISSILLVFQTDSTNPTGISKAKYTIGFLCTVGASAGYGLFLSLTEVSFRKVIKSRSFTAVLHMMFYPYAVATSASLMGLFLSGDWMDLKTEMEEFELGKLSYVMILIWTALAWQVFSLGLTGLIFEVSSLFSNVITSLGLPIVPIFSVILFHDKMDGVKVIALLLAVWGSLSYVYQQYIDDSTSKTMDRTVNLYSECLPTERIE